jgi:hypothetical protein
LLFGIWILWLKDLVWDSTLYLFIFFLKKFEAENQESMAWVRSFSLLYLSLAFIFRLGKLKKKKKKKKKKKEDVCLPNIRLSERLCDIGLELLALCSAKFCYFLYMCYD